MHWVQGPGEEGSTRGEAVLRMIYRKFGTVIAFMKVLHKAFRNGELGVRTRTACY